MSATWNVETIAAHGVRAPAPEALPEGQRSVPTAEPLYQTSVFDFPSIDASLAPLALEGGYAYARFGSPNPRSLELTCAALEGGEDAVATASGMAAIAAVVLARAQSGDRVLLQRDAYGGTSALFATDFARFGIRVEAVDAYDVEAVRRALAAPAAVVLVETYSNPLVRAVDVPPCSSSTTPSRRRSRAGRSGSARTRSCTRRPSSSAATTTSPPGC